MVLISYMQRFQKYYRNKQRLRKNRQQDGEGGKSAAPVKRRFRAASAINLFADSCSAKIQEQQKLRGAAGQSGIALWQEIRNELWAALPDTERTAWRTEAAKRKREEEERRAAGPTATDLEEYVSFSSFHW
jgi:hypothetical protein